MKLFTAQDLANDLGVSRSTVYAWVREGLISPRRAGRLMRFTEQEIVRFLTETRHARRTNHVAHQSQLPSQQGVIVTLPPDVAEAVKSALAQAV